MNIRVGGPGAVSGVSKTKGAGKTGGEGFSKMLDSVAEESPVSGAGGIGKINAVNFINSVDGDGRGRRRELVEEADDLLDELAKLRDTLLGGNLSVGKLQAIHLKIEKIDSDSDNPQLNDIIDEIKTRAAVELAKLGHY